MGDLDLIMQIEKLSRPRPGDIILRWLYLEDLELVGSIEQVNGESFSMDGA